MSVFVGARNKKEPRNKLGDHDNHTILSRVGEHVTCATCRLPAQLCASGLNRPCDDAFWTRQLAEVYNCHELPYVNLNARLTYKFFCTSDVVEYAFYQAKAWNWVEGVGAYPYVFTDTTDLDSQGSDERTKNCGKFPDNDRQRMYAFIALVASMDHFWLEGKYNDVDGVDDYLGQWRTPDDWNTPGEPYFFVGEWGRTMVDVKLYLDDGTEAAIEVNDIPEYDPNEGPINGNGDWNEDPPYFSEWYLHLADPRRPDVALGGDADNFSEHLVSVMQNQIRLGRFGRRGFYNSFLGASYALLTKENVLAVLRTVARMELKQPAEDV